MPATAFDKTAARRLALFALLAGSALAKPGLAQQQQQTLADYTLHPGDQLEIAVWKEPDLTKTVIIRPDGKFSFPLAGETVAVGRTVPQIQTEISSKLKTYIPEPVVTVATTTLEGNRVYVIGQVQKPGTFGMNPKLTVLQALSLAGGMTPYAAVNDIIIVRGSGPGQKVIQFRYSDVSKGKSLEQNVSLEAGDVVVVP
jgi:polysaccharide biosynthesis/export protein